MRKRSKMTNPLIDGYELKLRKVISNLARTGRMGAPHRVTKDIVDRTGLKKDTVNRILRGKGGWKSVMVVAELFEEMTHGAFKFESVFKKAAAPADNNTSAVVNQCGESRDYDIEDGPDAYDDVPCDESDDKQPLSHLTDNKGNLISYGEGEEVDHVWPGEEWDGTPTTLIIDENNVIYARTEVVYEGGPKSQTAQGKRVYNKRLNQDDEFYTLAQMNLEYAAADEATRAGAKE